MLAQFRIMIKIIPFSKMKTVTTQSSLCAELCKEKKSPTWRWEDQGLLAREKVLLQPDLVKLFPYALHLLPDPTHL
jgi:hypothetical protein